MQSTELFSIRVDSLLRLTGLTIDKYEIINRHAGETYNLFKLLGMASKEVKTHSVVISDLLSPIGTHQKGAAFLKLFLISLEITNFDPLSATVKKEYYVGKKSEKAGGRIDIILTDSRHNHIIIENK